MDSVFLKNIVGFFLVCLHLLAWFLCYKWLKSRLEYEDFRITVLIIAPVVTIYAIAFVKDAIKNKNRPQVRVRDDVTKTFAALAIIYAFAFGFALLYQIYDFSVSVDMSPNQLKDALALTEVIGGGIFGLLVDELFGKQDYPSSSGATASGSVTSSGDPPIEPQP